MVTTITKSHMWPTIVATKGNGVIAVGDAGSHKRLRTYALEKWKKVYLKSTYSRKNGGVFAPAMCCTSIFGFNMRPPH